jgi:hypothetical protein
MDLAAKSSQERGGCLRRLTQPAQIPTATHGCWPVPRKTKIMPNSTRTEVMVVGANPVGMLIGSNNHWRITTLYDKLVVVIASLYVTSKNRIAT